MASYTITTTNDQEKALAHAYEKLANPLPPPEGMEPPTPPASQEAYLQMQVDMLVLNPMLGTYGAEAKTQLMTSLGTIPEENRPAALEDLKQVVTDNGGTLPSGDDVTGGVFVQSPFVFPPFR